MQAGKLRHRITFEQPVPTRNSVNEEIITWVPLEPTVWGAIEPLTGRENYDNFGAQELAKANTRIRIRHRDDINHKMRAVFGTRVFDIQAVINVETRDRELHILCEEVPSV